MDAELILDVEQSPDPLIIPLTGFGLWPYLSVQENHISFDVVLPYPLACEKFFILENTNSFPLEYFYPDFDGYLSL